MNKSFMEVLEKVGQITKEKIWTSTYESMRFHLAYYHKNCVYFFDIADLLWFIRYEGDCEPTRFAFGYATDYSSEKKPEVIENLTAAECFKLLLEDAQKISNETGISVYSQLADQETKSHIVLQSDYEKCNEYVTAEFKERQYCEKYDHELGCICYICQKGFESFPYPIDDYFNICLEFGECSECNKCGKDS